MLFIWVMWHGDVELSEKAENESSHKFAFIRDFRLQSKCSYSEYFGTPKYVLLKGVRTRLSSSFMSNRTVRPKFGFYKTKTELPQKSSLLITNILTYQLLSVHASH